MTVRSMYVYNGATWDEVGYTVAHDVPTGGATGTVLAKASATDFDTAWLAQSALTVAQSQVTNLTSDLALKAPLASPALTGTPTVPTAAADTNTTQAASTAYVVGQAYAKLASPTLTGTPAAPTAAVDTNTTQIATTAFTVAQIADDAILKSVVDAKGDLVGATADNTPARIAGGVDGARLLYDSAVSTGIAWAASTVPIQIGEYCNIGATYTGLPAFNAVQAEMRLVPVRVPLGLTFSEVRLRTNASSAAGGLIRVGLYSADANGKPASLIADFGTFDAAAAAGVKAYTGLSVVLPQGIVYIATTLQGTGAGGGTYYGGYPDVATPFTATGLGYCGYRVTGVSAGLPGTATGYVTSGAGLPTLSLEVLRSA